MCSAKIAGGKMNSRGPQPQPLKIRHYWRMISKELKFLTGQDFLGSVCTGMTYSQGSALAFFLQHKQGMLLIHLCTYVSFKICTFVSCPPILLLSTM